MFNVTKNYYTMIMDTTYVYHAASQFLLNNEDLVPVVNKLFDTKRLPEDAQVYESYENFTPEELIAEINGFSNAISKAVLEKTQILKKEHELRENELSLLCCILRENEVIKETLFNSFDKLFEIAKAFIDKYGINKVEWGVDMEYEETVLEFASKFEFEKQTEEEFDHFAEVSEEDANFNFVNQLT